MSTKKLPVLKLPVHQLTLPVSNQKIEIKPYVIKEETSFLTMLNTEKEEDIVLAFKKLIENCVLTENFSIDDLTFVDFCYLILFIRIKSSSEILELKQHCEECEAENEFEINIEDSIKFENLENSKLIVIISNILTFEIVPPKFSTMLEIEKIKNEVEQLMYIISSCVSKVVYSEEIFADFTKEELTENILNLLTKKQLEKISEASAKLPNMFIEFKFICQKCQHENKRKIENVRNFF